MAAEGATMPRPHTCLKQCQIWLFLNQALGRLADVPDPYYGDDAGIAYAIDLIDEASAALVNQISV